MSRMSWKSWSLNLLEPSGPHRACNGTTYDCGCDQWQTFWTWHWTSVFRTLYITWPITTSQDALYSMEYQNTQHRHNVRAVIPPHPTAWRSILILSFHLSLGLPSGLFPSGFPTKTLNKPLLYPICPTCPAHLILLDFITPTILCEQYRSFSSTDH